MSDGKWQELVDQGAEFDDGFDEKLLREIQEQFQRDSAANSVGGTAGNNELREPSGDGAEPSDRSEEFHEFEEFTRSVESPKDPLEIELDPSFSGVPESEDGGSGDLDTPQTSTVHRRISLWKLLVMLGLGGIVLSGMGLLAMFLFSSSQKVEPKFNTIRRPLPLQFFSERLHFFFLAHSAESTDFLRIELEVVFEGEDARRFVEEKKIQLRDLIYRFLQDQKPTKNSFSHWQAVLENSLLKTLKAAMPKCNPQELTILNLEQV